MSALPKKLINHDFMPRIEKAQRCEDLIDASKKFIGAILIFSAFAFISHIANADGKRTKIAHAADCYGAQTYLDASDKPEYLVSPDMATYIVTHAHGELLTEDDMQ